MLAADGIRVSLARDLRQHFIPTAFRGSCIDVVLSYLSTVLSVKIEQMSCCSVHADPSRVELSTVERSYNTSTVVANKERCIF